MPGKPFRSVGSKLAMVPLAVWLGLASAWGQTPPISGGPVEAGVIEDLVAANRILADQGVLDGFGHVSIRHPGIAARFLMSRSLAPALTTAADIIEYDLECTPVDALAETLGGTAVVLMRGHGSVVVGPSVQVAVYRAIYTEVNARLQAQAVALGGPVTYLEKEEGEKADVTQQQVVMRPWELWKAKAMGGKQ